MTANFFQATPNILEFTTDDCYLIVEEHSDYYRVEIWYAPHINPEEIIFTLLSAFPKTLSHKDDWFLLDEDLDISGRECHVYSIPVVTNS